MNDYSVVIHVQNHTYLSVAGIAESYRQSKTTVGRILKEIQESGRYKDYRVIINDDGDRLVNVLIYEDYLYYRTQLKNRNLARRLPPFDPAEVRRNWGEYKVPVIIGG